MGLQEYNQKRNFTKTSEPKGAETHISKGNLFVIQKHAASRLHYDFRLEMDGVLKSWAVPKGPSLDPAEKRLAVQVEDHPLDYASFEGTIPENEYGGGSVIVWDRGAWEPVGDPREGLQKGKLKFRLEGEKLRGGWSLVRMGKRAGRDGENWLLVKEKDPEARRHAPEIVEAEPDSVKSGRSVEEIASGKSAKTKAKPKSAPTASAKKALPPRERKAPAVEERRVALPDPAAVPNARRASFPDLVSPQLAVLVDEVPEGPDWLHEIKLDGYRLVCYLRRGSVRAMTRNGNDWTNKFPHIVQALAGLPVEEAVLDGEVVLMNPDGSSDFQTLQNSIKGHPRPERIFYSIFDLVHYQGYDLTGTPLLERKEVLQALLAPHLSPAFPLRYSDHVLGRGRDVLRKACRFTLEGIVSKRADSPYEQRRSHGWVKVKCIKRQEFVIGGYTDPAGKRTHIGALLLGYYQDGRLMFGGKVGTGFNAESLAAIHERVRSLEQRQPPFHNPPTGFRAEKVHWLKPVLAAEVEFSEWTGDGRLRHPSFQGLREDKDPRQIVREEPEKVSELSAMPKADSPRTGRSSAKTSRSSGAGAEGSPVVGGVTLSHPEKVLYPEMNVTKQELARYYESVADRMLPHVAGRPLTVIRCPQGRQKKCFFQRHVTGDLPEAVKGIAVEEKTGEVENHMVIEDLSGLIALVQMGILEIHPWSSRASRLEKPDRVILDLDPGAEVSFPEIVEAAQRLREILEGVGLVSFVKTTGGKGLHILVPLQRLSGWEEAKEFSRLVVENLVQAAPDLYTSNMSKSKRGKKIFIDYLRNERGMTSVAPYSTRSREGAPVSTPLSWDELPTISRSDAFNVRSVEARLPSSDPWGGFFEVRQNLTQAARRSLR